MFLNPVIQRLLQEKATTVDNFYSSLDKVVQRAGPEILLCLPIGRFSTSFLCCQVPSVWPEDYTRIPTHGSANLGRYQNIFKYQPTAVNG
jgi:hypothetical protein